MNIANFRKIRGMRFVKRGMRVYHYHNKKNGVITGFNDSANLNVRFDGDKYSQNCHPTWEMKYFNTDGSVIADYPPEETE